MSIRAGGVVVSHSSTASQDEEEESGKDDNISSAHQASSVSNNPPPPYAHTVDENEICTPCNKPVTDEGILCEGCNTWFHKQCSNLTATRFKALSSSRESWYCDTCQRNTTGYPTVSQAISGMHQNAVSETAVTNENTSVNTSVVWGKYRGLQEIEQVVDEAFSRIVKWDKNIMSVPRGKCGKEFIAEVTRLLQLFNKQTAWPPLAIHLLLIFFPIMLQKPSANSKAREHSKYLFKRLELWQNDIN